ncbi:Imm8 family immunity protein [Priestia taiwanensis]|uniref:Immunity protein 8 n=1 Tax=Priestia taiwanensis TaxID=1347902 RepID=A0A917AT89_9BACI|nr:Imm8 family immunity protein [Priestia taiwanensis]MBM7364109.1 hypothetical protein [Priestia taiwanensis]GGE71657.1 hypothetical protein GCM10007140_22020 [Priestia taiwanensis]
MIIPKLYDLFILEEEWGKYEKDFKVTVEAFIGSNGKEEHEEVFTFYVVSPTYLDVVTAKSSVEVGRGLIIMKDFNIGVVETQITRLLPHCSGDTWEKVSMLLNRYGYGEYEKHPFL